MATANPQNTSTSSSGNPTSSSVGSPISNDAYDVISALHSKLEGLEAYRKYCANGNTSVWQELTRADVQSVELLVSELERLVREDRLRLKEPGRANA